MGAMRFLVDAASRFANEPQLFRGYVGAPDQTVYPTRIDIDGNQLTCRRMSSDSGKLYIPWRVEGYGRPVIATTSLREQEEPYLLPVELARGKIVQVRNQLAAWEQAGLDPPAEFDRLHQESQTFFTRAATSQKDLSAACHWGDAALAAACHASEVLGKAYSQQSMAMRNRRYAHVPMLLGCQLPHEVAAPPHPEQFAAAFNSAVIALEWRNIEPSEGDYHWDTFDAQLDWCAARKVVPKAGPLLDFSPHGLPEWLGSWGQDPLNLQCFVSDFVETVFRRYQGQIRFWEISARANSGGAFALGEEDLLCLVAKSLEVARHIDDESHIFVRIDQPWGEYQARGQHKLSPLQFADALLRTGLGLSGINLELAVGFQPRGAHSRDLLDYSRLIDLWSSLGVPLQVTLAFPADRGPDPRCVTDLEVDQDCWKRGWTAQAQAEWLELYLPLLAAKPAITGIFWSHYSDAFDHTFPHAGLVSGDGTVRPGLQRITEHRHKYLR